MENDDSALCFDHIVCQSGQFGFFQKRLFFINTLIQSACVSVLLYTCSCMPEVDESDEDACGYGSGHILVISNNGFHDNENEGAIATNITRQSCNLTTVTANLTLNLLCDNLAAVTSSLTKMESMHQLVTDATKQTSFLNDSLEAVFDYLLTSAPISNASMEYYLGNTTNILSTTETSINFRSQYQDIMDLEIQNSTNTLMVEDEGYVDMGDIVSALSETDLSTLALSKAIVDLGSKNESMWSNISTPSADSHSYTDVFMLDVNKITSTTLTLSHDNSSLACVRRFILLRTELKRTQVNNSVCRLTLLGPDSDFEDSESTSTVSRKQKVLG